MENPNLDLNIINLLEHKVKNNTATPEDYELIDFFISSIGGSNDFILSEFKSYNIFSYSEYIDKRKMKYSDSNRASGYLLGYVEGAINVLNKYLNNQI